MRRWGLALALLLSVGVNLGILATLAVRRTPPPTEPAPVPTPVPTLDPTQKPESPEPADPEPEHPEPERREPERREPERREPERREPAGEPAHPGPPPEEGPGPGAPPREGQELPRAARLADRLGLEGEPRRRFLDIQNGFFTETVRLRTEQAEIFRALRRELTAQTPDRARIEELTQASGRVHMGLQQAMAKNVLATREVLDPPQERLFLDVISRLAPPGLGAGGGGVPEPPLRRRPPPWQPRRPRWR